MQSSLVTFSYSRNRHFHCMADTEGHSNVTCTGVSSDLPRMISQVGQVRDLILMRLSSFKYPDCILHVACTK